MTTGHSSSVSLPLPLNVTASPSSELEPFAGAVIVTVGAVFAASTVMLIWAEPLRLPLSVTDAVIVCVPTDSVDTPNVAPLPIAPSRFELHDKLDVRSPSSVSLPLPLNVTASPSTELEPFAGAVIVTVGAVFAASTVMLI